MTQTVTPPEQKPRNRTREKLFDWKLLIGVVAVGLLLVVSLFTGVYDIFNGDFGLEMFAITRIPRTIALVLAGAAMAMCGLVMQLLTQNRFVEPTTTGTTEWAGLGLLLMLILVPNASLMTKMVAAIIASFVGTMIFFLFLRRVQLTSSLIVPIVGIMIGAVVGSVSTYLALVSNKLQNLGVWFAGSFTSVLRGQYEALWIVAFVAVAVFIAADRFTVAGLGEDIATNVGLNYNQVILLGTGLIAVATGVVTVVVGNLPFLGLIVPNVVSMIRGDDLRSNLPWVCLLGIAIVTVCDLIGRTIIMPFEVPVSLILGVVGAVVFIALLLRSRRNA
jgi:iron complex transport system permease protein